MPDPILMGPFPPPAGGVATFFTRLTTLLSERGYAYRLKRMGGQTDPIGHTWSSWWQHLRDVERGAVLLDNGTNFIESPSRRPMLQWIAWKSWRRFYWVKVLHSGTLPQRYTTFNRLQQWLLRASFSRVDVFVCVNETLADWLTQTLGIHKPIMRISSLLPLAQQHTETVRLPPADFYVVSVGIFTENYGFDDVVQAVERVRQLTGQEIHCILLDAAFDHDPQYHARIVQGQTWLHTYAALPSEQVFSIMQQSTVFVRATRQESYGLSKVEALMVGVPVICTPVGETRGMTQYAVGDIDDLAEHIMQCIQNNSTPDLRDWQALYQQEAEDNLAQLIQILYEMHHA